MMTILLVKTAAQNEVGLSYHKVRGLYFLAVVFEATISAAAIFVKIILNLKTCKI